MMRWILLTLLVGLTVFAWSQDAPDVRPMLRDVFPVSQLKPGMRGYGLTVFKGTKIERFEVEVVGVLDNALYGYPLVMIMMRGGPITERGAMVIAGMSGSPIFIEGKILGALAYGFIFPKEPVALVTPLEAMLTNLHPRAESQLADLRSGHMIRKPVRIAGVRYAGVYIGHEQPTTPNVAWARPLMTPIMVSGVSPRTMKYLEAMLQRHGFTPLMVPSGGTAKQVPVRFEPGAAVATPLATGDIDLSAIGTLTYRKGDYVLAFGHPFFGVGAVEMPMHAAEIVDVFSSYAVSFKLGNRAQPLGAIYYDGAFAVAGRMGQRAKMIPMTARITNPARAVQREYRCEVFNHPMHTGQIALTAALEFLDRVHFEMGEASATVRWRLQTRPFGEIRYENRVATRDSLAFAALSDLNYALNLLMNAPERKVELERIELEMEVQPGRGAAVIDSLQVDRFTYRPGERIEATVQVRTRDGATGHLPHEPAPARRYDAWALHATGERGGRRRADGRDRAACPAAGRRRVRRRWGRHRSATARVPQPRAQLPDDRRAEPAVPDHQRGRRAATAAAPIDAQCVRQPARLQSAADTRPHQAGGGHAPCAGGRTERHDYRAACRHGAQPVR